ncbi:MAG: DUF1275 domain-containing protein [Proteobacteria bacterium]|nr:DUF1275 domain-containing protein [Pseudomonadota bacterium]
MKKFEHHSFVMGLGFVAGFIDVFGFTQLGGLLPAHVTGTLIFLAINLSHGQYNIILKLAALPIFCVAVLGSAWFIGAIAERGRDPFLPALLMQAALLLCGMIAAIVLPKSHGPDGLATVTIGTCALAAMGLQNTIMRLILNNLPPTTVMTGNITQVLSDTVGYACRFSSIRRIKDEKVILERQAKRMLITVLSFLAGALAAAFTCERLGEFALCLPVLAILCLIPFGQRTLSTPGAQPAA